MRNTVSSGLRLATRLKEPGILRTPGAHNGLATRKAGFEALYVSGAGLSASKPRTNEMQTRADPHERVRDFD